MNHYYIIKMDDKVWTGREWSTIETSAARYTTAKAARLGWPGNVEVEVVKVQK